MQYWKYGLYGARVHFVQRSGRVVNKPNFARHFLAVLEHERVPIFVVDVGLVPYIRALNLPLNDSSFHLGRKVVWIRPKGGRRVLGAPFELAESPVAYAQVHGCENFIVVNILAHIYSPATIYGKYLHKDVWTRKGLCSARR